MENLTYILGPMRGIPYFNFPSFDRMAEELVQESNYTPVSPADIDRENGFDPFLLPEDFDWDMIPEDFDWDTIPESLDMAEIIARDLAALQRCDYYVCLPGWENSKGARAEKAVLDWKGATDVTHKFITKAEEPSFTKPLDQLSDAERKALPIYDGALSYFPNALALMAGHSLKGQMQHAPDQPLQWHREKSQDELGSLSRHLLDYAIAESRGDYEEMESATAAMVWRACAHAERFISTHTLDPERYQNVAKLRGETHG